LKTKPLSLGIIGAGGIARRKTLPALARSKKCRVVAVADPVRPGRIAAEFGVQTSYRTAEALLNDPGVEAVYIASPVRCHAEQIAQAAQAGKHVLCEKPLALNLREARAALAACRKHRVILQEGYMMKFHGAHRKVKQLIDEGRLGQLVYLRAQLSCWYPKMAGAWRQDPKTGGGGSLIDMATHLYDLLEFFGGPIQRIVARTGNLVQDYRSEDAATTLVEFASGAHGTIDAFFCIPDEASRTRLEIYGSRGALLSEGTIGQSQGGKLEGVFGLGDAAYDAAQDKDTNRRFARVPFPRINPYLAECDYFADCVRSGRSPGVNDAVNALRILDLAEKAYRSARGGRVVAA
jgi:predicted dehydrogenase